MAVCLCTVGVCLFAILDSPQLSKACCHCAYNSTWIEPLNFALYLQSLRGVRQAFTALDWSGPALPSGKHCGACASRTQVVEHRVYIKWPQEDLGSLKKKNSKKQMFQSAINVYSKKKKTSAEKVLTSVVYRIQSKKLRCGSHACLLSASEWCDVWLYTARRVGQRNSACRSVCTEPRLEETTFVIRLQETETPTVPAPVRLWVEGSRWGHFILEIPLTFFLDCLKKKKKKLLQTPSPTQACELSSFLLVKNNVPTKQT